jgi:hypothetical protein
MTHAPRVRGTLLGFLLLGHAAAADRFVAMVGNDTGTCSASGSPCRSPAYALTQAGSGDTIRIAGWL